MPWFGSRTPKKVSCRPVNVTLTLSPATASNELPPWNRSDPQEMQCPQPAPV